MSLAAAVWLAVQEDLSRDETRNLNYFDDFEDEELFQTFHLTRPCISFITDYVSLQMTRTPDPILTRTSPCGMVMTALDYYANGTVSTKIQDKVGLSSLDTPEVIYLVSKVLSNMVSGFITFPRTRDSRANVAIDIQNFCGIPNVLGAVACLHIRVRPAHLHPEERPAHLHPEERPAHFHPEERPAHLHPEERPAHLHPEVFINTLGFSSVMTQIICDCDGNILSVDECCVGSTNQQNIWDASVIGFQFEGGVHGSNWIIAGSGYTLGWPLLTPVSPAITKAEKRFNAAHAKVLRVMQETITALKKRFLCLKVFGHAQQDGLDRKGDVINACCVLHNIAKKFSVPSLVKAGEPLEPMHPRGQLEAMHPGGQLEAMHPGGQLEPMHPGGQLEAMHPGGQLEPMHPGGQLEAMHPGGQLEPMHPGGQLEAMHPGGQLEPMHPGGQFQSPSVEVSLKTVKAREDIITGYFSVPAVTV